MLVFSGFEIVEKVTGKKVAIKTAALAIEHLPKRKIFTNLSESAINYLCVVHDYGCCRECFLPVVDDTPNPVLFHETCLTTRLTRELLRDECNAAVDAEIKSRKTLDLALKEENIAFRELQAQEDAAKSTQEADDTSGYDEENLLDDGEETRPLSQAKLQEN